ncbi:MAG: quinone oxidoreductase [Alphaproteobacteria bacterium]|nr:quinone oxidoreductase [Alphaproteobacteria bacterium SS10]
MTHAIRIHEWGGPEKMVWEPVDVPAPSFREVTLKQSYVGLNFIDVYHRTGLYPVPSLPAVIGMEGCGVVEAVGEGVTELAIGDRVAYASPPVGSYAEVRNMPADRVVKLPDTIDDKTAAGMMLQGMTVEYLLRRTYPVKAGQTILVHAAAGGVGLLMCQWAKHLGATVIGTVGSVEKAELAKAAGCDHTILYRKQNFAEEVNEITDGKGVPVIYDGIGADTVEQGFQCLKPRGMMVTFGNASGPVPEIPVAWLAAGSHFVTRPSLMAYTASRDDLLLSANALFKVVQSGAVKIDIRQTYPLSEAGQAHYDLESRQTTGTTVFEV